MAAAVATFEGEVAFCVAGVETGLLVVGRTGVDTIPVPGFAVLVAGSVTELVTVPVIPVVLIVSVDMGSPSLL